MQASTQTLGFGNNEQMISVFAIAAKHGRMREKLAVKNKKLLQFVPDYRINLLSPEKIADPDFDKFRTGLGAVMQFIKHQKDESMDWMAGVKRFEAVDRDTASLIQATTGTKLLFDKEGGAVNMCNAWEKSLDRAKKETADSVMIDAVRKVMEKFHLTAKEAMDTLEIPAADRERYAAQV